jgi:hypothetical protein
VRNSLAAVLEYLILKVLADKEEVVKALYDYFVEGASPSTIATRYGLSKHQIRGYVQRIMEKTGSGTKARVLMKYTIPIIIKIKPITKKVNGSIAVCGLCNEELPIQVIEDHVRKKHANVVNEYVNSVIEVLRKALATRGIS